MVNSYYFLTISRTRISPRTLGYMSVYSQGTPIRMLTFEHMSEWAIIRRLWTRGGAIDIPLNRYFIAFQRLWRAYISFLRRVRSPRFLRDRELFGLPRVLPLWPPTATLYAAAVSASGAT